MIATRDPARSSNSAPIASSSDSTSFHRIVFGVGEVKIAASVRACRVFSAKSE
jgi:hypothetical protein